MFGVLARPVVSILLALSVHSVDISVYTSPTSAPVPQVLAWVSFAGADGPISSSTLWTSGEAWSPLVGTWAQSGHAAVVTSAKANARAMALVAAASDHERIVAVMTSRTGVTVVDGGVIASSTDATTRSALIATVAPSGALELRSVTGVGAISTLIASTAVGVISGSSIEISLRISGGVATATARSLAGGTSSSPVTLFATPSASLLRDLAGQTGYGIYANSTIDLAFTSIRVEVPL